MEYWFHYEVFIKFCWDNEKIIIDPKVLAWEGTHFNLTDVMNTSKKMIVILQLLSFFIITYWFGWNWAISTCKLSSTPNKTYELIVIQRPYTLNNMTSRLVAQPIKRRFLPEKFIPQWYFVTKIVLVIEKIFWDSRVKAENLQKVQNNFW